MKKLPQLILIFSFIMAGIFFFQNRERFLRPYDYTYFGNLYSNSQYVIGQRSQGGIGDDGLYAFAGYYYIAGGDISQVSFESPPLAKYLIGVSIVLFHNELVINIIYSFCLLLFTYFLGKELTGNRAVGALAAFFVARDPLLTSQFALSMLDLPMTLFFLVGIYFFIRKKFVLAACFFSLSFASRFFPILPILLGVFILGLWRWGRKGVMKFVFPLVICLPLIYLSAHIIFFRYHPSLLDFLRYQIWIINWRIGEPFVLGNMFTTILTGYYRSWWQKDTWLFRDDWSFTIPIFFILGAIGMWKWRKKFPQNIVAVVILAYIIYAGIGTVGVTKFLLPIYPIVVIFAVDFIIKRFRQLVKS